MVKYIEVDKGAEMVSNNCCTALKSILFHGT